MPSLYLPAKDVDSQFYPLMVLRHYAAMLGGDDWALLFAGTN